MPKLLPVFIYDQLSFAVGWLAMIQTPRKQSRKLTLSTIDFY